MSEATHIDGAAAEYFEACSTIQRRWLQAYINSGNVTAASKRAGVEHLEAMKWLRDDESFQEAFERARLLIGYALEGRAMRKAESEEGSDRLIIEMLRAMLPHKYDPNYEETEAAEDDYIGVVVDLTEEVEDVG